MRIEGEYTEPRQFERNISILDSIKRRAHYVLKFELFVCFCRWQSIVVVALRQASMSYQMSHWGSLVSTVEVNATV